MVLCEQQDLGQDLGGFGILVNERQEDHCNIVK